MQKIQDKALSFAGAVLIAALVVSAAGVIESGLPKSAMQAAELYAGSVVVVLFIACVTFSKTFRTALVALLVSALIAALIASAVRPVRVDGWVLAGLSVGLGFALVWSLKTSALVRRWFFGAVVLSMIYPVVVIVLPRMPTLSMRLLVGLVIASPIGAWAGWRVWPAIERWHFTGLFWARDAIRAGWQNRSAAVTGEITAEDFLKRRDFRPRDKDR